jgi:hypothetical protein
MQVAYNLSEQYGLTQTFITLSSTRSSKNVENNLEKLIYENKKINDEFNEFFRALFKDRLFKKLTKDKRFYIKANEFTKRYFLHTHFIMALTPEYFLRFIDIFTKTFENNAKKLNIGRSEVVIPLHFYNQIKTSGLFKVVKVNKQKVLMLKDSDRNNRNFFYIKTLKENRKRVIDEESGIEEINHDVENDIATLKYGTKYVYKNYKDKMDNFDKMSEMDALYSLTKIRRINFSRFSFPQYLYEGLKDGEGKAIYEKYDLATLSHAYHVEKGFKIEFKANMTIKTAIREVKMRIVKDEEFFNKTQWDWNCDLWLQCDGSSESEIQEDRKKTRFYEQKRLFKELDKVKDFYELDDFLWEHFEIDDEFCDKNIKYTLTHEKANLTNKYLNYMEFDGCRYYLDTSIKYVLAYADDEG